MFINRRVSGMFECSLTLSINCSHTLFVWTTTHYSSWSIGHGSLLWFALFAPSWWYLFNFLGCIPVGWAGHSQSFWIFQYHWLCILWWFSIMCLLKSWRHTNLSPSSCASKESSFSASGRYALTTRPSQAQFT